MTSPAAIQRGLQAFGLAQELRRAGRYAEAVDAYNRALALMPDHPNVLAAFAQLADEVQDWKAAEKLYRRLGELRPQSNFEPLLARALFQQERYAEAIPYFEASARRPAADPAMLLGLANCHSCLGHWDEGLAWAERAWAAKPEAKYLDAVLIALFQLGRDEELDRRLDDAYARFPGSQEIRSLYALHKLKSGRDYAGGFAHVADMRWRNNRSQATYDTDAAGALWDGKPFAGTLRVVADAGLGDQILGSSMFGDLAATGQRTQVLCDERLLPLFRRAFPTLEFLPRTPAGEAAALATFNIETDRRINAIDLGVFFRRSADAFPARRAWLQPDAQRAQAMRAAYRARWPGKNLVGISWKSTRIMEGGAFKGIQLTELAPLLARPDCVFINLQYGDVAADIAALRAQTGLELHVDPDIDCTNDIDGFAAQLAALDRVVSTSNTTVHVAGALGVSCRVLLPKTRPVLWYWGYRGERTPWYPSLQLLRSASDDDWKAFIAQVAQLPMGPDVAPGAG